VRYLGPGGGHERQLPAERRAAAHGKLQPEQVERLKADGRLAEGERRGDLRNARRPHLRRGSGGVTTRKGQDRLLHVFDWADPRLLIPSVGAVKGARALKGGAVKVEETPGGLLSRAAAARSLRHRQSALELK
jgi:hypothetical protein